MARAIGAGTRSIMTPTLRSMIHGCVSLMVTWITTISSRRWKSITFIPTIAFIPWNYDRSEQPVVALFRGHPERFSICIHGDNHDHKEFDDYESKSLSPQIAALGQSLARMDKFQALTGIPYDKVFVFPHNIGSERILEQLKTYNFDATVNSLSVPMDRTRPASLLFILRPVTLFFGDFPSVERYWRGDAESD